MACDLTSLHALTQTSTGLECCLLTNVADDGSYQVRLVLQLEVVLLEVQVTLAQSCKAGLHLLAGQGSCPSHKALHL